MLHMLDGRSSGVFGSAICMKLNKSFVIDTALTWHIFLNEGIFAVTVDRSFE